MTDESRRIMWKWIAIGIMAVIYVAFSILNVKNGGVKSFAGGSKSSLKMVINMAPELILMFLLSGQIGQFIMLNYGTQLRGWIDGSGGMMKTTIASILSPSSITILPIVKDLWNQGAGDKLMLTYFMVISNLLGWQIMMIRGPLVSWSIYFWVIMAGVITSTMTCLWFAILLRLRDSISTGQIVALLAAYLSFFAVAMSKLSKRKRKELPQPEIPETEE